MTKNQLQTLFSLQDYPTLSGAIQKRRLLTLFKNLHDLRLKQYFYNFNRFNFISSPREENFTVLIDKITSYFKKTCRKKMQSTKPFHTISSGVVSGWSSASRPSASLISCPVKVVIAILNKSAHGCIEVATEG